jgi:hypothetical protein
LRVDVVRRRSGARDRSVAGIGAKLLACALTRG